jgi:hypothetical protein
MGPARCTFRMAQTNGEIYGGVTVSSLVIGGKRRSFPNRALPQEANSVLISYPAG